MKLEADKNIGESGEAGEAGWGEKEMREAWRDEYKAGREERWGWVSP